MKPETIEKYLAEYSTAINESFIDEEDNNTSRLLTLMMKEIERDVRHKVCDELNLVNNRIHNLSI
jgi:hypothetical protein